MVVFQSPKYGGGLPFSSKREHLEENELNTSLLLGTFQPLSALLHKDLKWVRDLSGH